MRMPGWYDIADFGDLANRSEDEAGVLRSQKVFHTLIQAEIDAGIPTERIVLGGFSQGGAMSLMAGTQAKADAEAGRVLCLMNMITPEELMDTEESEGKLHCSLTPMFAYADSVTEILDDVKEECAKYGKVLDTKMPRPTGGRQGAGIGKIYVKYEEPASAQKALAALAGRKFADRTVVVTFFGEEYFDINAW